MQKRAYWRYLKFAIAIMLVGLAGALLYRTLSGYTLEQIVNSVTAIPGQNIGLALLFAGASYFCLTLFDWLALRYVGKKLPYAQVALASFCSLSLGHNIGFAALSSGAIRYRFYSRWGVSAGNVAKIILFCGTTVGLGLITLGGLALLLRPDLATQILVLPQSSIIGLGIACIMIAPGYIALSAFVRTTIRFGDWHIRMPAVHLAVLQVLIGPINFAFVAACLHQVLSGLAEFSYFAIAAVYVIANGAAISSHVPGGLGVLEFVVLYLVSNADIVGALVAFRVVYYLIPLAIGGLAFAVSEIVFRSRSVP